MFLFSCWYWCLLGYVNLKVICSILFFPFFMDHKSFSFIQCWCLPYGFRWCLDWLEIFYCCFVFNPCSCIVKVGAWFSLTLSGHFINQSDSQKLCKYRTWCMYKMYFVTFKKKMHLVLRLFAKVKLLTIKLTHTHNNSFFENSNVYIANFRLFLFGSYVYKRLD